MTYSVFLAQIGVLTVMLFGAPSFASNDAAGLIEIPSPPSLQGANPPPKTAPAQSSVQSLPATIGTKKSNGLSQDVPKINNGVQGLFSKKNNDDQARRVIGDTAKVPSISDSSSSLLWSNQMFPAANTFYSDSRNKQ